MSVHLDRARVLLEQSRPEMAEKELRQALAADPDNAQVHALLALCLGQREEFIEATREAQLAIHLAPDTPFPNYVLAFVLLARNRPKEAESAILEAIRIDPDNAHYYALLGEIRFRQKQWAPALNAAEQGLAIDPEDVQCTNIRAMSLIKLGRKDQAQATMEAALARNPENAATHASQGWTLLEKGQHVKAMEHFREALRLNPESDWARQGIVEALKSRHFIYRIMLAYFLWMAKLSSQAQWVIIIGGYAGYRVLSYIARTVPQAAPWIWPVLGLYIAFAVMSWLAVPLFNLLLRLNRFGRLALSREQIVASNWVGGCLLLALLLLIANFVLGWSNPYPAVLVAFFTLPLSAVFQCDAGWPRRWMALYTAALGVAGTISVVVTILLAPAFYSQLSEPVALRLLDVAERIAVPIMPIYLIGVVVSQFVANILMQMEVKR